MTDYNKEFIEKLNIYSLLDKYNIKKGNCTSAIFYALSSVDKHFKSINKNEVKTLDLLFGDYYSFQYYDLLKNDLKKLEELTLVMKNGYVSLLENNRIEIFILQLVKLLFSFYSKKILQKDEEKLLLAIGYYYKIY